MSKSIRMIKVAHLVALSWFLGISPVLTVISSARADGVLDQTVDLINTGLDIILPGDFDMRDLNIQLGVGIGFAPEHIGADNYSPRIVPLIAVSYKDRLRFFGTEGTVALYTSKNFRAGGLLRYRGSRNETDSASLMGLGDVKGGFELGGFMEGRVKRSVFKLRMAQDVSGGHDGLMITLTADQGLYISTDGKVTMGAGIRATWVSKDYNSTYFGITPQQSQASGLDIYSPSSGVRDVAIRGITRYDFAKHWRLSALIQLSRLTDDTANSPLVRERGSATQALGGVGIFYRF